VKLAAKLYYRMWPTKYHSKLEVKLRLCVLQSCLLTQQASPGPCVCHTVYY